MKPRFTEINIEKEPWLNITKDIYFIIEYRHGPMVSQSS
jgi:hypothetical protein